MENTQYLSEILYNIQFSKEFLSEYLLSCNVFKFKFYVILFSHL